MLFWLFFVGGFRGWVIHIKHAALAAHMKLSAHSEANHSPAILGAPCHALATDIKFQEMLHSHVLVGERLAQAALQTEMLVCQVAGVEPALYLGRFEWCGSHKSSLQEAAAGPQGSRFVFATGGRAAS